MYVMYLCILFFLSINYLSINNYLYLSSNHHVWYFTIEISLLWFAWNETDYHFLKPIRPFWIKIYLSFILSIYVSIYLYIYLRLWIYLSINQSISLSINLSIWPSIYLFVCYLPIDLNINLYGCLSVCLSIYLCLKTLDCSRWIFY